MSTGNGTAAAITDSNRDTDWVPCHGVDGYDGPLAFPVGAEDLLNHILIDVHEILQRLNAFEAEARPLLDAYKRTNGGTIGLLRARKGLRDGG